LQLRGHDPADLRYSGKDRAAGEEAVLRLRPGLAPAPGDKLFRLTDVNQMAEAAELLRERPIQITMEVALRIDQPLSLTASDGTVHITVQGEVVQRAKTRAATADEVRKQLTKLGDTPFTMPSEQSLTIVLEDGAFAPVSALNAIRRDGVQALIQARAAAFYGADREAALAGAFQREEARHQSPVRVGFHGRPGEATWTDTLAVRFGDAGLAKGFGEAGANLLIFAPNDFTEAYLEESLAVLPAQTWLELSPWLTEDTLRMARCVVERHAQSLAGVAVGSVGQLGAEFGVPMALGSGVPLTNRAALAALAKDKPAFWMLWPELTLAELMEMKPQGTQPLLRMYGRERLMLLGHCPERVRLGLGHGREACRLCSGDRMACGRTDAVLKDRKGMRFPLQRLHTREGCVIQVLNALPTDLRRQEEARKALGAGMLLSFTVEPPEEQLRLTGEFARLRDGQAVLSEKDGQTTQGRFLHGVE
jgi:putative protease